MLTLHSHELGGVETQGGGEFIRLVKLHCRYIHISIRQICDSKDILYLGAGRPHVVSVDEER